MPENKSRYADSPLVTSIKAPPEKKKESSSGFERWVKLESKFIFFCSVIGGILVYLGVAFGLLTHHVHLNPSAVIDEEKAVAVFLLPYLLLMGYRIVRILLRNVHGSTPEEPNQKIR